MIKLNRFLILSNSSLIKRLCMQGIPKSKSEYNELIVKPLQLPENPKLNRIAVLGVPNAGKSTLVNAIVGYNICGESSKPHTTRQNMLGIYTEKNVQISLTDTPGCVSSKYAIANKLQPNFLRDPAFSCEQANIIAILYDCSRKQEPQIARPLLKLLYKHRDKRSILIITKIDLVKDYIIKQRIMNALTGQDTRAPKNRNFGLRPSYEKDDMEELFRRTELRQEKGEKTYDQVIEPIEEDQKHWPYFSKVFFVSSFDSIGIDDLKKYFIETSYQNPWLYNSSLVTIEHPGKLIVDIIKSKLMDNIPGPASYNLTIAIIDWVVDENGSIEIVARGRADNNFYVRSVIGPKGKRIAKITNEIIDALTRLFRCPVHFRLELKYVDAEQKEKQKEKLKKSHKKTQKEKDLI